MQKQLLAHTAPSVKPGGKLIYAVCTLTNAETKEVVENFNLTHPEFEPLALEFPADVQDQTWFKPSPAVWIWPQDLGGNGMFVAAWRRKV